MVYDGYPVVGVIYNPATDEMFSCQKSKGVYLNGHKVSTSQKKNLFSRVGQLTYIIGILKFSILLKIQIYFINNMFCNATIVISDA